MMTHRMRSEDSGTTPRWKERAGWKQDIFVKLAAAMAVAIISGCVVIFGIRAIPGGVVVGSQQEVTALRAHLSKSDSLSEVRHTMLLHDDSIHVARIDRVERRLSLHDDILKAFTRDKCGMYGVQKAEALGYPCKEVGFHLSP